MGVDFIREESGKPWRKRWHKGRDRLKIPSLFDVQFSDQQRTVAADIECGSRLKVGDQVIVQFDGPATIVCSGQQRVGKIPACPADMQTAISNCGGVALGTVERISLFGNHAELSIR